MTSEQRSEDPRKARTRSALQAAALSLFAEKPIHAISIGDVVAKAGVNRSSFYMHYSSLHGLFADALDEVAVQAGRTGGHSDGGDASTRSGELPEAVRVYVQHIYDNAETYRWALGPDGSAEIVYRLRERFRAGLAQGFEHHVRGHESADLGIGAQASFLAGGLVGAITQWIRQDSPLAPDEFSTWLWAETRLAFAAAVARATGEALAEV